MVRTRLHLWLIRFVGLIVPQRLRAAWRQEWEAELRYREALLSGRKRLNPQPCSCCKPAAIANLPA